MMDQKTTTTDPTTRDKILTAARAEFARVGRAGARIDRIAAEAGVNKAMIYYHFDSKENLHREVISDYFARIIPTVRGEMRSAGDFETVLRTLSGVYHRMFTTYPDMVAFLRRELAEPDNDAVLDHIAGFLRGGGMREMLLQLVEREITAGRIKPLPPKQILTSFIIFNAGYFMIAPLMHRAWEIDDPDAFLAERQAMLVDLFMDGIRMRGDQ